MPPLTNRVQRAKQRADNRLDLQVLRHLRAVTGIMIVGRPAGLQLSGPWGETVRVQVRRLSQCKEEVGVGDCGSCLSTLMDFWLLSRASNKPSVGRAVQWVRGILPLRKLWDVSLS